jgi:hypothetical protein
MPSDDDDAADDDFGDYTLLSRACIQLAPVIDEQFQMFAKEYGHCFLDAAKGEEEHKAECVRAWPIDVGVPVLPPYSSSPLWKVRRRCSSRLNPLTHSHRAQPKPNKHPSTALHCSCTGVRIAGTPSCTRGT